MDIAVRISPRQYLVPSRSERDYFHLLSWQQLTHDWRCDCLGWWLRGNCYHAKVMERVVGDHPGIFRPECSPVSAQLHKEEG